LQAGAGADRHHEVDSALLEYACPYPIDDIVTAPLLNDDGIDAVEMQYLRK
jgi:hypothetical protein